MDRAADDPDMSFRIAGFNDRGEARIVDEAGRLVGFGELLLEDAHLTGVEPGDLFGVALKVSWTPSLPDPDGVEIDWDGLLS